MRKLAMAILLLSTLLILPVLLASCNGDGTTRFALDDCQLDNSGCRLQ